MATAYTAPGTSVSAGPDAEGDGDVEDLIDAYRQPAFNLAYRLVRRPEDAADAVQDAFVLAMRASRGSTAAPREPGRFRSWLLKIVANVALAQLRRRKSAASVSLDALTTDLSDGQPDQPLTTVVRREQRGDVLQALLALPDAQRAALTLREYQGLSYDEIGEMLGMERGAITALLYRARAGFRVAYEGVAAYPKSVGCSKLAPLISAMLDEELEVETWGRVDRHLTGCVRCRRELKQLRRGQRLHGAIPMLAPPAGWSAASTLGAAGASAATGLAAKAPALGGLVERAAELTRPLVTGSVLGAAAVLPGGPAGGLGPAVERGFTKLAGLAMAAGLLVAVAAGSPSHSPNADAALRAASAAAPAVAVASAAQDASGEWVDPQTSALPASIGVQPAGQEPALLAPGPAAPPSTSVVGGPATAGGNAEATALTETIGASAGAEAARLSVAVTAELPAGEETIGVIQRDSASPAEEVAHSTSAGGPASAGPSAGASSPAGPPSSGPPAGHPSTGPSPAGGLPGVPSHGDLIRGGSGTSPGQSPPTDPPGADVPPIDVPPLDLPAIDLPVAGLPPIDLPAIDLPPVDLGSVVDGEIDVPPVDLPPVDLPPVDLGSVARSVVGQTPLDLPTIDVPALDVPAVDLPRVELPLVEGSLDRARDVVGLPARALAPEPIGEVAEQIGQTIPLDVLGPDVARGPAGGPGVPVSAGSAAAPGISVSSDNQGVPGVAVSTATGSGPAEAALSVDASIDTLSAPGAAANGQTIGAVELNANVANDAGAAANILTSADTSGTSLSVSAAVDTGTNSADSGSNSTSLSVSANIDTGSNGSNNSDSNSSGSNSLSVSVSVDSGSSSSGNNDSNSNSSNSLSVSVSVDSGSSGSNSSDNNSSNSSSGVSVSAGGISVSVP